MDGLWQQVVGVPCLACNAASPASANGGVFTHAGPPGQLFRLDGETGAPGWVGTTNGVTSYSPPTVANGVVYIVDGAGFLTGFDAGTGAPVLKRNLALDSGAFMGSESTSAGIAVARNTLYVAAVNTVFAFRLGATGGGGGGGRRRRWGGVVGSGTPIVSDLARSSPTTRPRWPLSRGAAASRTATRRRLPRRALSRRPVRHAADRAG